MLRPAAEVEVEVEVEVVAAEEAVGPVGAVGAVA
jgi:hypothetical protein